MRILFSADHHIKLKAKNVPVDWQINRFILLGERLSSIFVDKKCDLHIIGGDLLDVATPSSAEVGLMHHFLKLLDHTGLIYSGNHEALNKKESCLYNLAEVIHESTGSNWSVVRSPYRSKEFDIIDFIELHKKEWVPAQSELCFTHVRGTIEPHVSPEIDLMRFVEHGYARVIAGDLHSVSNTQLIMDGVGLMYPGSPMTTSFHRERPTYTNGCYIIDTDTKEVEWVDLGDLPQLIRKTVKSKDEMVKTEYDHTIYEIEGDILDLKGLNVDSELFDKKINNNITSEAKLNLEGLSITEEAALYLEKIQNLDSDKISRVVGRIQKYVKDSN